MSSTDPTLAEVWDAPPGAPTDDEIEGLADPGRAPVFHEAAKWAIDSDDAAEWAMARLSAAQDRKATLQRQADEWARKIAAWFTKETAPLDRTIGFFDAHLRDYALRERARDPKRKTVKLPSGRVSTTGGSRQPIVVDEAAVIEWAKRTVPHEALPNVVATTEKVLVRGLRQCVWVVEVPTKVVMSCGCVFALDWTDRPTENLDAEWTVGTGRTCPSCGEDALVGQWTERTLVVRDEFGEVVPGVGLSDGEVHATVSPS